MILAFKKQQIELPDLDTPTISKKDKLNAHEVLMRKKTTKESSADSKKRSSLLTFVSILTFGCGSRRSSTTDLTHECPPIRPLSAMNSLPLKTDFVQKENSINKSDNKKYKLSNSCNFN